MTGTLLGATWRRPNGACNGISPEPATTRRYTVYSFQAPTAGTYNATITRTSGGTGVYVDLYQGFITGMTGSECTNRWELVGSGGAGDTSVSKSIQLTYATGFAIVVSGNSDTDNASFSITISGPQAVTNQCGLAGAGSFSPASQTGVVPAGGSYSTVFTPSPGAGCGSNWTSTSVPSWITGFPTSGSGRTTINYTVAANGGAGRTANISTGGTGGPFASFSVTQSAASCTYSLSASSANVAAGGGNGSFTVTTQAGCGWSASDSASWLTGVTASGTGTGTVNFTAAANAGGARSAAISVGGHTFTVNQAAACNVSLSPSSASPSAAGGTASFAVTTAAGCAWTVSESSAFLSGVTASGTGPGTVSYTVAANSGPARSANIQVTAIATGNSASFAVNQQNGCTYALTPTSTNAGSAGGNLSFAVSTGAGCTWSSAESASWISGVTASGTGPGTISFNVAANTGPVRSASISVGGQNHVVNQASGCSIAVTPASASPSAAGGTTSFAVNTTAGCGWSVSESSAFLSAVTASGTGNGNVSYTVAANNGPARSASITVSSTATASSATFSVNQSNGCTYALAPATTNAGTAAGNNSFSVTTAAGCTWTTAESASWISGVTASGTGTGTVSFSVAANSGPARSASITVNGQTHTVSQASGCSVALSPSSATPPAVGGTASFNVSTDPGCAWTVSESASFLSAVTATGTGSGSVSYTVAANDGVTRTAPITVTATETSHSATFTVNQGNGCVYSLPSSSVAAAAGGGGANFTLSTSNGNCPWNATSNAPWLTGVSASGNGSASVAYTVAANLGPARSGTITAGGQTFTVHQADGCVTTLPSASTTVAVTGESKSFAINLSAPTCTWTANGAAPWLSAVTPAGTGNGNVSFTAAANSGPARSATISAGGQTFSISQASGCSVALPVDSANVVAAGGNSSFVVNTAAGCAYTATSDSAWLTASVAAGSVNYTASASNDAVRVATVTVTSTTTASTASFEITQESGCVVMLSSGGVSVPAAGQDGRVDVTSGAGCSWEAVADDPWLTNVAIDAAGVTYSVDAYAGPERSSVIHISNAVSGSSADFVITQESGCVVSLTPGAPVPAAGGAQSVAITTAAGCGLTVSGSASWLSNVTLTGTTLSFDLAQNDGIMRQQTLTVTSPDSGDFEDYVVAQSSGCAITLPIDMASLALSGANADFAVSAGPGCSWTAVSSDAWVENLTVTATGVSYSAPQNDGVARTSMITVTASETGDEATFVVDQPGLIVMPTIMMQPSDLTVDEGSPFELSVVASGGELSYAWFKDAGPVASANGMTFGAAMAELDDEGNYTVVVSNAAGSVTSDEAHVEVIPRPDTPQPTTDGGVPSGDGDGNGNGDGDHAGGLDQGYGVEAGGGGCSVTRSGASHRSQALGLFALFALGLLIRRRRAREPRAV